MIEEADAWFEYLEATRGQTALRYREVEPWAWARLRQRCAPSTRNARSSAPQLQPRLGRERRVALLPCGNGYADEFDQHAARAPSVIGRP